MPHKCCRQPYLADIPHKGIPSVRPAGHTNARGRHAPAPFWTNLKPVYRCESESLIMRGVMNTSSSLRELLFVVVLNRLPT